MEKEHRKLAQARYRKGWSQEQVAESVGVARSTLSQWERGVQTPQEFYVHRLCDFYQMTRAELGLEELTRCKPRSITKKTASDTLPSPHTEAPGKPELYEAEDVLPVTQAQLEHMVAPATLPLRLSSEAPPTKQINPTAHFSHITGQETSGEADLFTMGIMALELYQQQQQWSSNELEQRVTHALDDIVPGIQLSVSPSRLCETQDIMKGVSNELEGQHMDEVRRQLMQQVLSVTGAATIAPTSLLEQFAHVLARPSTIDETTFRYLETRTAHYWSDRHGAMIASSVLRDYVLEHLQKIVTFLGWPLLPSERRRLCALASGTAQLVGHLFFDLGDYSNARNFHKKAIVAAQEAGDRALEAVAWGRISFTWTYGGNIQKAFPCIQKARSLAAGKTSQTVQAYLSAIEAEIQAIVHNQDASLKALGEAERINTHSRNEEDHYWLRFDRSRLEGYQGTCFRRFYHPEDPQTAPFLTQAQKNLKDALALLSPSMMQRRPTLLIDLASTYTQQREIGEACDHAIQAIIILAQLQSRTGMQRLLTLRQDLAPWHDTSYVKNVDNHIEALLVPDWRRSI